MVKKFEAKYLRSILFEDTDGLIDNSIEDMNRWGILKSMVFKHEDKFYQVTYEIGATEQQDVQAFDDDDHYYATEVVQKDVVVTTWVAAS